MEYELNDILTVKRIIGKTPSLIILSIAKIPLIDL